jgi:hypothetical protein
MNEHRLVEYLASIGQPEGDRTNARTAQLSDALEELTHPADTNLPAAETITKPPFVARDEIRFELFNLFATNFMNAQRDRGVELYWVGIGTWKAPTEIIPETVSAQHIEAWKLSIENLKKQRKINTGIYRAEAIVQEFTTLIQEIPVAKPLGASTSAESTDAMKELLNAYRLQLIQAVEFMRAKRRRVPEIIVQAVDCLNDVLGESWQRPEDIDPDNNCPPSYGFENKPPRAPLPGLPSLGSPTPSEPSTIDEATERQRSEEHLYDELLIFVQMDRDVADRLIEYEQKLFPKENRRKWIERARDRLLHDRGASFTAGTGSNQFNDFGSLAGKPSTPKWESDTEIDLYNELLGLLHGDRAVADRLIAKEQGEFPNENRRRWIERAKERLLHDRGAFT